MEAFCIIEIMADHVHVLIEAPPPYAPSEIVQVIKSISAREMYKKFPKMRKQMWIGKIWNERYYVRSVGDKVTSEVIKKYIKYQKHEDQDYQIKMFDIWYKWEKPSGLLGGTSLSLFSS